MLLDPCLRQDAKYLLRTALSAQGLRAFDNPLSAATAHEAGHAILYAAFGYEVRSVKVWRKKRGEARGQWVGFTTVEATLRTGPDTEPEADFIFACIIIAGVLSEQLFDTENFRAGSSIDEVAQTRGLAANIGLKTGADFSDTIIHIFQATGTVLRENERVVRGIAAELARRKIIGRNRLASFLKNVQPQGGA